MVRSITLGVAALATALTAAPPAAGAMDAGALYISQPWIRATTAAAPTAAGYLAVTNHGKLADRLLGAESSLARSVEPHTMSMAGGVMRMRLAPDGFEIAPGATLTLAPGGDHLMFIGPKGPFTVGENVPVTLRFARAGSVRVVFTVRTGAEAAKTPAAAMEMH